MDWSTHFANALPYLPFLDRYATPPQRTRWDAMHPQLTPSPAQAELLASFTRRMHILVLNAAWCGDCINQCPMFDHFDKASPAVECPLHRTRRRPQPSRLSSHQRRPARSRRRFPQRGFRGSRPLRRPHSLHLPSSGRTANRPQLSHRRHPARNRNPPPPRHRVARPVRTRPTHAAALSHASANDTATDPVHIVPGNKNRTA